MPSINKIFLIGKLTKNPETKNLSSGTIITTIKIVTTERIKNINNYTWHRVIAYNNLAKIINNYLNTGDLIFVQGKIQNRKWINDNNEVRYITEIIANEIKIIKKDIKNEIEEKINKLENFNFENDLNNKKNKEKNENEISEEIENDEYFETSEEENNDIDIKKNEENKLENNLNI